MCWSSYYGTEGIPGSYMVKLASNGTHEGPTGMIMKCAVNELNHLCYGDLGLKSTPTFVVHCDAFYKISTIIFFTAHCQVLVVRIHWWQWRGDYILR
jgi:hypothetical protein